MKLLNLLLAAVCLLVASSSQIAGKPNTFVQYLSF